MSETLVYTLDGKVYINLTNRCTNSCVFCLRNDKSDVCGQEMWLDSEDITPCDVINQLEKVFRTLPQTSHEITFCGYGEPLLKLDILKEVAKYIKEKYPEMKVRINTNGHANYVYKRNIVPELAGLVDVISVSLNGADEKEYNELSQPKFEGAYEEVKKFIKECAGAGIKTFASIVDGYKGRRLDTGRCKRIAQELGAELRIREWIPNGYS